MNEDIGQLLLCEIRDFRKDFSDWREEISERVSALEATVKPAIIGNGQPSWIKRLEDRVTELEQRRWKHEGLVAGLWLAATAAWEFIRYKLTGHM